MGALNVTEIVGRLAAEVPDGDAEDSDGATPAANAAVARGEATVAIAARAAVNTDRRINAEAIWVLRSDLVRPTTQRGCGQVVTTPAIAPARPRVKVFAARPPTPASDFVLFARIQAGATPSD
jgi:hypothetical protein